MRGPAVPRTGVDPRREHSHLDHRPHVAAPGVESANLARKTLGESKHQAALAVFAEAFFRTL